MNGNMVIHCVVTSRLSKSPRLPQRDHVDTKVSDMTEDVDQVNAAFRRIVGAKKRAHKIGEVILDTPRRVEIQTLSGMRLTVVEIHTSTVACDCTVATRPNPTGQNKL